MSNFNVFGVTADSKEVQSTGGKSWGKFGLNKGSIISLKYVENTSKMGNAYKAIELITKIGDSEYKALYLLSENVYEKGKEFGQAQLLSPGMPGYDEAFFATYATYIAIIKMALHAVGVKDEPINAAVAGLDNSKLLEGIQKLTALMPANSAEIPVDIFLEYEWNIREGQEKTYLIIPKTLKGGKFLVPHLPGTWAEKREDGALSYVNENNQVHPFTRTKSFMESNKAIQQTLEAVQPTPSAIPASNNTASNW